MTDRKKSTVLADHHRQGKRLIPPIMRLNNIVEVSFRDTKIPELVWMSAIFNHVPDREAVRGIIEFLIACNSEINDEKKAPPLSFLSNFLILTAEQKKKIVESESCKSYLPFLREHLWHQMQLLDDYPLAFIFEQRPDRDRLVAIERLKKDVAGLLDRYADQATKVQTTAVVAMMATDKMFIAKHIDFPHPDVIFTAPDSSDAKRVASFVRATLNAGAQLDADAELAKSWVESFWSQAFNLEGCF
jgi:hypothetical protein